jgi:hypothetical protein
MADRVTVEWGLQRLRRRYEAGARYQMKIMTINAPRSDNMKQQGWLSKPKGTTAHAHFGEPLILVVAELNPYDEISISHELGSF